MTHLVEVWTLWYPVYWYSGVLKAFTTAASLGTAWMLFRLKPQALALTCPLHNGRADAELGSREHGKKVAVQCGPAR